MLGVLSAFGQRHSHEVMLHHVHPIEHNSRQCVRRRSIYCWKCSAPVGAKHSAATGEDQDVMQVGRSQSRRYDRWACGSSTQRRVTETECIVSAYWPRSCSGVSRAACSLQRWRYLHRTSHEESRTISSVMSRRRPSQSTYVHHDKSLASAMMACTSRFLHGVCQMITVKL